MDQRAFWTLLRRRWLTVLAFLLVGGIAGSTYVLSATPQYSASAELFVAAVGADNSSDLNQGSNYSQQQARSYSVVATRQTVLEPVITALGLETTPAELADRISATVPLNTSLITVKVTDTSADRAAATANAVATSLINTVSRLVPKRSDGSSPVRLETVQSAVSPTFPVSPNARLGVAFGLLLGLVAGIAFVILRELTGAKVRSAEQVKQTIGVPVLGTVSYERAALAHPIITRSSASSPRAEEFRHIRTNLGFLQAGQPHKAFVVTSSIPGEGKSSTSVNIASSIAASGSSVCLVEADLRKPSLAGYLDLEDGVGYTTVLSGQASLDESIQRWGSDGLHVLLSGAVPPNPSELLGSAGSLALLETLRNRYDVVIIDSPPLMPVTDAAILAQHFGGAILVVGCGKVEVRELRRSIEDLQASGSPILGAVANFAPLETKSRYKRAYQIEAEPVVKRRSVLRRSGAAVSDVRG